MLDSLRVLSKTTELHHPYNMEDIKRRLDNGTYIIVGDMVNATTPGLKYVIAQIDGLLYAFKLSDSSNDTLVFTPEQVSLYNDEFFSILWEYIKTRDFILADDDCMLDGDTFFGDYSHEKGKNFLTNPQNAKTIIYLNDNRTLQKFKK